MNDPSYRNSSFLNISSFLHRICSYSKNTAIYYKSCQCTFLEIEENFLCEEEIVRKIHLPEGIAGRHKS